jgi:hypothetical protein
MKYLQDEGKNILGYSKYLLHKKEGRRGKKKKKKGKENMHLIDDNGQHIPHYFHGNDSYPFYLLLSSNQVTK